MLAACGRIGFDAARTADGGGNDGVDAPPACTGPFLPPVRLAALASPRQDAGASMTADGLELYVSSNRDDPANLDLYVSRRASRQDTFTMLTKITELSTPIDDDDPYIESDGLALWFNTGGDIVRSTRPDRASAWSAPVVRADLSSVAIDDAPGLTSDGLTVYFDSARDPNLGNLDLWSASRSSATEPFANLRHEVVASSNSFDCCPHVLPGDTQVAFTTQRAPGTKVYVADRMPDGSLGTATPYALVNSAANEIDVFSTPDGATVGVASDRFQPLDFDLWLYERSCP